jgi:hypothetical protein
MTPSKAVAFCKFAQKTLDKDRLIAMPKPRRKKEQIMAGKGAVQTIGIYPQIIRAWDIMSVRPLPRRDRRASTKKAASINPTALVTKMRDTVQRISHGMSFKAV